MTAFLVDLVQVCSRGAQHIINLDVDTLYQWTKLYDDCICIALSQILDTVLNRNRQVYF